MPVLRAGQYHLERLPSLGFRESQASAVPGLWTQVDDKGQGDGLMTGLGAGLCPPPASGPSSLFHDLERSRELRVLLAASKKKIARLQRAPAKHHAELEAELALHDQAQRELQRLERRMLYAEFGFL